MNTEVYSGEKERPLYGCKVFITGGTRDIGEAIVLNLLPEGVNITTTYSRVSTGKTDVPRLNKRAAKTDSQINFIQADLTTVEGFGKILEQLNGVDILILNTSGVGPDINVHANQTILKLFLELRKARKSAGEELKEATVILMQSQPGHFSTQIQEAVSMPDFYSDVAPPKYKNEQLIHAKSTEIEELNVKYFVVCPPEAPDTVNVKVFSKRLDKDSSEKSRFLSRLLGLPEFMASADIGKKVVEVIKQRGLPNGHIELFDPKIEDATRALSEWYKPETMYVTTMQVIDQETGIGRYITNPNLHGAFNEPPVMDSTEIIDYAKASATLTIKSEHMMGHTWAFPGHKQVRTMVEAAAKNYCQRNTLRLFRLASYKSVSFRRPILTGDVIHTTSSIQDVVIDENKCHIVETEAEIEDNGQIASELKRARLEEILNNSNEDRLLEDQLIEGAAQSVVLLAMRNQALKDVVPLFVGTGEANFYQPVNKGDNLLYFISNLRRHGSMFSADVRITRRIEEKDGEEIKVREEEIANIKRILGAVRPKE